MTNERIKSYTFQGAAYTGTEYSSYSSFPIVGEIQRVLWLAGSGVTGGSLWVYESGTSKVVHQYNGIANAGTDVYPRIFPVTQAGAAISGAGGTVVPLTIRNVLFVGGSGVATGSYFGGCTVYYK